MNDISADDYPPLSALNHLLYCERRCALLRIENVWVDNAHTVSGTLSHERADRPVEWKSENGREVHGMWLRSDQLRLVGKADVVEFHDVGESLHDSHSTLASGAERPSDATTYGVPFPVEYKRGKRKKWDNDDVQLCAQALCLEEMLGVAVPCGAIFHIQSKRRREVTFTPALRALTLATAERLHALLASGITPPPVLKPQCQGCSVYDICLPSALIEGRRIRAYMADLLQPASLSGDSE